MADIIARHAIGCRGRQPAKRCRQRCRPARPLAGRRVLGGMVPFNVMALGQGRFHRATSGDIVIDATRGVSRRNFSAGLTMRPTDNIDGVQWGKLLLNLNDALNALTDLRCAGNSVPAMAAIFADQLAEALAAIRAEGSGRFRRHRYRPHGCRHCCACRTRSSKHAGTDHEIDPEARSSMWEDLNRAAVPRSIICRASLPGSPRVVGCRHRCRAGSWN